ncbi:MAG: hypothetical protein OXD43_14810 [Bacteroidetes bacterium]|nr:hypothetical protein [Bacteroidota bacterium]
MTVSVQGSFQRSVNLVRDFHSTSDLGSHVVTTKTLELIERVVETLTTTQTMGQAWSIIGPYGGGKSSFALFLAYLLQGDVNAHNKLISADPTLFKRLDDECVGIFCPVLVVGSQEPLNVALLRGLIHGASSFLASFARHPGQPTRKVKACRNALRKIIDEAEATDAPDISDKILVDLYERTAAAVHAATNGGLLLIVDELGKFLEYAALYPDRSDLYVLQSLAERASRTGKTPNAAAPVLMFTISHQAFDQYARRMSTTQRDEWRKIQGRFEDFAFVEPISETLQLLARAVQVDDRTTLPKDGLTVIDKLLDAATLRPDINRAHVRQHLANALPLHPAVSLIVGPLFRRLAQNKRSLFAFLASGEPSSFLDVIASQISDTNHRAPSGDTTSIRLPRYRLDHLYDYLVGSVGTALFNERIGNLWAETEAVLSRLTIPHELAARCVKQIALLSFAGPLSGLSPTAELLHATTDAAPESVDTVLGLLKRDRLVTYRPFTGEYHIWQGSDFDLDASLRKAREQLPARTSLAKLLADVLPPTPIVARRHSFRTGITRVFEVVYASDEAWSSLLQKPYKWADGRIIYVLSEHDGEAENLLASIQGLLNDSQTLVAVPDGVTALREVVRELSCLEWVRDNADELKGDKVARHEVNQRLTDLRSYVEQRLISLLIINAEGRNPCTWIYQGESFRLQNERSMQDKLSQICDEVFSDAPEIWNELLNRCNPSPSAVKGLKLLLKAMLKHDTACRLNIKKYPAEYGMYTSILEATKIHCPSNDDPERWHFTRPDPTEHSGCAAVWDAVMNTLQAASGQRVSVQQLYDILCRPPYGVREGLVPVFLFAVYKSAENEIAVYENGTFVSRIDFQTIERFLKNPDKFELQWVEIKGVRVELLHRLAPLVGLSKSVQKPLPFVLHILERIHGLPPYVRRTATLSQIALNVREALHHAIEPTTVLFEDLPEACGVSSFLTNTEDTRGDIQIFVEHLQEALRELSGAYDTLLADLQTQIVNVFRLHSETPDDQRHELAERARLLLPHASDSKLKAFLVRAADEILDTQGWYESIASLLAKRPPVQWRDADVAIFSYALREVARRFYMLEPIVFDVQKEQVELGVPATRTPPLKRIRLSVTVQYEDEHEQVISIHPEDHNLIDQLYRRLQIEIEKEDVTIETKIAALAQLSNKLLNQREVNCKHDE